MDGASRFGTDPAAKISRQVPGLTEAQAGALRRGETVPGVRTTRTGAGAVHVEGGSGPQPQSSFQVVDPVIEEMNRVGAVEYDTFGRRRV